MTEAIRTYEDVLLMLDALLKENSRFSWDAFYSDRTKGVPFFVNAPDENLVEHFRSSRMKPGNVLELGCGPDRNAVYFAERGCVVDAVDSSVEAIEWAMERAGEKNVAIRFINQNIFNLELEEGKYDIVYDSGCFHHIAPHRRMSYLNIVNKALKPGGLFGLTCFQAGGELGGALVSDWDVYRVHSLKGGLGFTEAKIKKIFQDLEIIEIRQMKDAAPSNAVFGVSSLLTALFKKRGDATSETEKASV